MGSEIGLAGDISPLRRFTTCKEEIRRVFKNLHEVIEETGDFLGAIEQLDHEEAGRSLQLRDADGLDLMHRQKDIAQFRQVVAAITALLERDNMKVVFVGHTSNGKSTVINTMLGDIVLPMGIGHTTHCFCSVEGTSAEPFMQIGDDPSRLSITTVKQVANALSPEATENRHQSVRIFWDKDKCKLLSDGVVLIDTPGLDIDENYDMWIDKFCMDADVFVLVANGEATLKQTEMTFLRRVSEKLSRPNVFVLFNRWDGSDMEDDADSVRAQHLAKASKFLKTDLQLDVDGDDRVFFVSAKEMIQARVRNLPPAPGPEAERRAHDFVRFESNFAECISASAIRTKFEAHVVRGRDIAQQLHSWLGSITWTAKVRLTKLRESHEECSEQLATLDTRRDGVLAACEGLVDGLGTQVEDEFERAYVRVLEQYLDSMVDRFDFAVFSPTSISTYKERLVAYVGREMCRQLQAACGTELDKVYGEAQKGMEKKVKELVPQGLDFRVQGLGKSPIVESLFTAGLLDSFHEDIAFRFSLGWSALGPRILGSSFHTVDGLVQDHAVKRASEASVLALVPAVSTLSAYVPLLTVGATMATRPSVWKLVLSIAGVWAALYGLERLTYTNAAKERRFKRQFVDHVRTRYQAILVHTSLNVKSHYTAAAQAQLARLRWQVDERKAMVRKEIGLLDRAVTRLAKTIATGDAAIVHSRRVCTDLVAFCQSYLPDIHQ